MKNRCFRWSGHHPWLTRVTKGEALFPIGKRAGLLALLLLALPSWAAPSSLSQQLTDGLRADAETALGEYLRQQAWPETQADYQVWLSPAVAHLPDCRQAVRYQAGGQYRQPWGRRPYLVECTEPAWQLRARVEVTLMLSVWVTAREIQKGQTIGPGDLVEKSLEVSRLQRSFVPSNDDLVGSKSTRHLRMGQLIGELDLQQAWAVRAGEGVLIRAGQPGFSATTRGQALANGAIGEGIRVRNLGSGKEIQAWVIDKGEVETRF
ncbi:MULTISPECIES: lateral flagellar basal body P-ring formation protein LfgA [Aeromonas]|uniref:lateral flagellar basal body P-ring formation protein LfgA n=1 Tax=Aeromonas TaxID=642 RepID=UPI000CDC2ED1|nr:MULTISPECIES: lateral flagellar basal body P-ring formation protein LfgA [Aeromonas]AUY09508.1 flagella basal body P-ring formation protein FlgA [Aeromonas sp. ASNIH2]MEB5773259.1 lateral flagellar basal body P-ring formation protein LfgA [Aeromonas caviae]MEB6648485.1 lateral flagellar basal body P-ring formation protein LfgA [Aeromonas caviae]